MHGPAMALSPARAAFLSTYPIGRADADVVRQATGFTIGVVPPFAHTQPIAVLIDASLARFERVYAAAGHPHCVFATSVGELVGLTGAPVVEGLGVGQG